MEQNSISALKLYRRTIKNSRLLHKIFYALFNNLVVPCFEKVIGFYTSPDDPLWFRLDMISGKYESETTSYVKRLIEPGMTVLDVGAHVGFYTQLFSKLSGKSGRVIAFEPNPNTFQFLIKNTKKLQNVVRVQKAVSDKDGDFLTLYDAQIDSGSSSIHISEDKRAHVLETLANEISPRIVSGLPVKSYNVEVTTIDKCIKEQGISQIDFIKMDIEGAEVNALRGMQETIKVSTKVKLIMELAPTNLRAFGFSIDDAVDEIRACGFSKISAIDSLGNLIRPESGEFEKMVVQMTEKFSYVNLLCEK